MTPTVRPSPSVGCPAVSPSSGSRRGYTANHVCDMLNWGRGKVGRFEANQWKRPEMSDIRDLLRIYEVDEAEQEELEELAMRARDRPWWRDYPDVFDNEFPGFETDAVRIRVFMPLVMPGAAADARLRRRARAVRRAIAGLAAARGRDAAARGRRSWTGPTTGCRS